MYQNQLEEHRKSQSSFMDAMQKSQESVMNSIVELGENMSEASKQSAKSNHMVLIAVLIICIVLVFVFIVVVLAIRAAAKASAGNDAAKQPAASRKCYGFAEAWRSGTSFCRKQPMGS